MQNGSYAVIRFSNNLSDQRVNLGVIVWHPLDGFSFRCAPSLACIHSVNATADTSEAQKQLDRIQSDLTANRDLGAKLLITLRRQYNEGVEVSQPYPARVNSLKVITDRLFDMLVTKKLEIHRHHAQPEFEDQLKAALYNAQLRQPTGLIRDGGKEKINGVTVDIGTEVTMAGRTSLWHALALQFQHNPAATLTKAKAMALDVITIRERLPKYKQSQQIVAFRPIGGRTGHHNSARSWLQSAGASVIQVDDDSKLSGQVNDWLSSL